MGKKSDIGVSVIENNIDYEPKIATGFDRGVDYEPMKNRMIKLCSNYIKELKQVEANTPCFKRKIQIIKLKILYLTVAMIQLRNGSRISEACAAMRVFCSSQNFSKDKRVIVKIAKSESIKYKDGEKYVTKPRYRKLIFPSDWINNFSRVSKILIEIFDDVPYDRLKKRVLDYLLMYLQCNTHSLRYACINYLIYEKERPLNDVAKFVGHVDLSMLTKYTQQKNCEKIFDLDM